MLSDKAYLAITAAVSVLVLVLMALVNVPWWLGLAFCLPLAIGGLIVKRHYENTRAPVPLPAVSYQPPPPPPPPPAPPASVSIKGVALPSAHHDYRFLLHGSVLWRQSGTQANQHPRPSQLAIDAIRERAARFTERESPADVDLLATRLATELSFPRPDRTGSLEAWAQDTVLTIPDDDRVRLHKIAAVRKDEEVWEYERAYERNKRAYLRDDVLTTPGSAVVWWLAQDTTRVSETVGLIGTLAQLVAAAQNREVEPVFRSFLNDLADARVDVEHTEGAEDPDVDVLGRLMARLVPDGSEPERADLADRLARIAEEAGATDLASTIRERFDAPAFTEQDPSWFTAPTTESAAPPGTPVHPNGQAEPGATDAVVRPPFGPA
ncbi:hypothetical protein [Actinophytocola gossypii]|uniref:Secreted protein n=1 Tax=Actinophytocola gossypii TaxID=2812003 RepID=A0ABT2J138_9PSEU|nr:hypothetical protein [Actinophytocola gossypii]MCT2581523.1 hypothetical protein [Actinophytocola gossypii]